MQFYEFVTNWHLNETLPEVWKHIKHSEDWPKWWKGVLSVVELKPGDSDGVGAVHRSVWKSVLPYKIEFDSEIIRIEDFKLIEARAFGELDGNGLWQFFDEGESTHVRYDWRVRTTKHWMNLVAPIAKPLFGWNHDVIMGWGETGLKKLLAERTQTD
ncbi:MAG: SRPBCC family protein [Blastocatellia bacterium]